MEIAWKMSRTDLHPEHLKTVELQAVGHRFPPEAELFPAMREYYDRIAEEYDLNRMRRVERGVDRGLDRGR
jgi:hypothetical protein